MPDFQSAYRDTRERVSALALELDGDTSRQMVPACPEWTTKDLLAHVAGIAADMLAGNVEQAGRPEWTRAQIDSRRERGAREIIEEWSLTGPQVEAILPHIHPAAAGGLIADLATHEHDLRGALGRPGGRDSPGVEVGTDSYVRWLGRRIKERDLPALAVEASGHHWVAGKGDPEARVRGSSFEVFRALGGRRTIEEVEGLEWIGDPAAYLPIFSTYGWPERSLQE